MKKIRDSVLAIFVAIFVATPAIQAQEPAIRVLQVTGGVAHDYENQQNILSEGLKERLDVHVDTFFYEGNPGQGAKEIEFFEDPSWIEGYDVVLYNKCWAARVRGGEGWVVKNIITPHVENKIPAVFIHGTLHSYRFHDDAEEWHRFIGVSSFRHQRRRPFEVQAVEEEHPIIAPMPLPWNTPGGELYWIVNVFEGATILARAKGTDGEYHPVIWTNNYAGIRNFGTSIGHHNETLKHPVFLDMLSRGLLHSIGRQIPASK